MADYFLSDVHLRLDRPDRGDRLARVVDQLGADDRLIVVGDLGDFWYASRQTRRDPRRCGGFRSLLAYRERGGELVLMLGNHDAWLGPFYESLFGITIQPEPFLMESHGLRVRLAHGHRIKTKSWWKSQMEGRAFHRTFGALPHPLAAGLESLLDVVNVRGKEAADRRMTVEFRELADSFRDVADLVVFGHVHTPHDDPTRTPRLVVLGDWTAGAGLLRIDDAGAIHRLGEDALRLPVASG